MAKKKPMKRRKRPAPKTPRWFLVRQGFIQNMMADPVGDGTLRRCLPVFFTREDAQRFAHNGGLWEKGVRPAELGSVDGESLDTLLAAALKDGCEFIVCPEKVVDDESKIRWGHIAMRRAEDDSEA